MKLEDGQLFLSKQSTSAPYLRLVELVGAIPEAEAVEEQARLALSARQRELDEAEELLVSQAEGKNAEERKANLTKLRAEDERVKALRAMVFQAQSDLIDLATTGRKLRHEERAIHAFLSLRTAQINFLAGCEK